MKDMYKGTQKVYIKSRTFESVIDVMLTKEINVHCPKPVFRHILQLWRFFSAPLPCFF